MNKKGIFALWGGLYIVCAGLGFIPAEGTGRAVLTALAIVFFLPPAVLLYRAGKEADSYTLKLIRNLSAWSLVLTAVLLIANVLSVLGPEGLGVFLNAMLTIVSAPMLCCGAWAVSLFLWACLLIASRTTLKGLTQKR